MNSEASDKSAITDEHDPARRVSDLEEHLRQQCRVSMALRDIVLALGTPADLDNVLRRVLEKAADLVDAERATLYLTEETTGNLVSRHTTGAEVETIRLAVGHGIAGSVVESGCPVRVRDVYDDPRFDRTWDELTGFRTRSTVAVPMKNHAGHTIGVLQALNKRGADEFSSDDEDLLGSIAAQAATSIDNARLFESALQNNEKLKRAQEQLERKVAHLKLLFELENAMASAASESELVGVALVKTVGATKARAGGALIAGEGAEPLTSYVLQGDSPQELIARRATRLDGVLGYATRERAEVNLEDIGDGPSGLSADDMERGLAVRSVLAVPLVTEGGLTAGALALYDRTDAAAFSQDDLELVRLVAVNLTTAISLQRAREQREKSDQLSTIGRLMAGVMHDLKTPLTVISGYVQMLAPTEDGLLRNEYAVIVLKQLDRITAMQREVLAFARGERSLLASRVHLPDFFRDLRQQIEREILGRPVTFELRASDCGAARFDETKMTRVFHNLMRNAIEAMGDAGGTIGIDVTREGDDLIFSVRDTGPGIAAEIEGSLFESFVTTKRGDETGNAGLGLAIVKKIVEEHGGSICVKSSDRGACFAIRLPQTSG